MNAHHNLDPMLVSWCVAVAAAYAAFDLGARLAVFEGARRWLWLLAGAVAAGSGIWAVPFTGMQALSLPQAAGLHPGLCLLAWVVAVLAAMLGLLLIGRPEPDNSGLAGGGLSIGLGIVTVDCLALAALRLDPPILFDLPMFDAALLLAAGLSIAALLVGYSVRRLPERQLAPAKGCGALLMGAAISAMHHAVLAAAPLRAGAIAAPDNRLPLEWLGAPLALFVVALIAAVLLLSMFDAQRLEARLQERQQAFAARFRRRLARS
jgi:NO-binding membrane sensor protein with MHYT domain